MRRVRSSAALAFALCGAASFVGAAHIAQGDLFEARSLAAVGLLTSLAFVAAALAGALALPAPVVRTLGLSRPRAGSPSTALILAGQLGTSIVASAVVSATGGLEGSELERIDQTLGGASPEVMPLLGLGVALAPGIAEELLFRGLLLGALLKRAGTLTAISISTGLFALAHIDPAHAVGAGILGLYLAAVRVTTGSTPLCMLSHIANNGFAIFLAGQNWPPAVDWIALPLAAGACLAACSAMWLSRPADVAEVDNEG